MKILFVCLGNICRSPLAEGIMKDKISKLRLNAEIDSAGFESFHVGDPADPRSADIALKNGISLNSHIARKFTTRDFDHYDRIYVMDRYNHRDVMSLARNASDRDKVDFILNLSYPGENREVPDPYYGGKDGFEKVFRMLDSACDVLAQEIANHHPSAKGQSNA
jgi:protein-tyrosine phosphatase